MPPLRRILQHRSTWVLGAVLAVGAALRLWAIGAKPGWQADEPVYESIARNLAFHGALSDRTQIGLPSAPFLFHPPFYFILLAGWFRLFGAGITQARVMAVIASLVVFVLLFRLLWKLYDVVLATIAVALVSFDGWMIYAQRISYIENTLLILVVLSVLLYVRALETPSYLRFGLAGACVGAACIFKHTGVYVLFAVVIHLLMTRRHLRQHALLFAVALGVIGLYVLSMILIFDRHGHDWYLQQSLVQLERTFGIRQSAGTLTSPIKAIELLSRQYYLFVPSVVTVLASLGVIIARYVQCAIARSFEPVRGNELLISWATAAVVAFSVISVRFPQYFVLILVPLYSYLYAEAVAYFRTHALAFRMPARVVPTILTVLIVGLGLTSAWLRVGARRDNVLAQVRAYAFRHIPRRATVITIQSVGDEIPQSWCTELRAAACGPYATYVIEYTTFLQPNPVHDPALYDKLRGLVRLARFYGFKETATIWGPSPHV